LYAPKDGVYYCHGSVYFDENGLNARAVRVRGILSGRYAGTPIWDRYAFAICLEASKDADLYLEVWQNSGSTIGVYAEYMITYLGEP